MNAWETIELINKYASCPNCGNEMIGNGQGAIIVEDTTFTRKCKCGFEITIEETI
jgi:iron(III) transport system ATP-binding protein